MKVFLRSFIGILIVIFVVSIALANERFYWTEMVNKLALKSKTKQGRKMKKKEHIDYWLKSAQHDLEVAETLFSTGKYDWCLFIGHLVLEKTLKALFVKKYNKFPPKIHNLVRLAELCNLKLTDEQKIFLDKVNDFNIEVRYPDYKLEFYKKCTKEFTLQYFEKIKEYYKWFISLTKSKE